MLRENLFLLQAQRLKVGAGEKGKLTVENSELLGSERGNFWQTKKKSSHSHEGGDAEISIIYGVSTKFRHWNDIQIFS